MVMIVMVVIDGDDGGADGSDGDGGSDNYEEDHMVMVMMASLADTEKALYAGALK